MAGDSSPDSAAVKQLLHVVEGLEEELFSSEARRNDAEVCPQTPSCIALAWNYCTPSVTDQELGCAVLCLPAGLMLPACVESSCSQCVS